MNIFMYELKNYRKSLLVWSITIFGTMLIFMGFFPAFASNAKMMDMMLENYPEELLKAFGMAGTLSLTTIEGYYVFIFVFIQLFLAIQASNYGFSILSVEERDLTADFLMTKPVSRKVILFSKFGATMVTLLITNGVTWLSTFLSIELYGEGKAYEVSAIVAVLLSVLFFQLFFLSVGLIVSVSVRKVRSVLSFSMALSFGMYVLNAVRSIIDGELLGYLTPFYYFEPGYIAVNEGLNIGLLVLGTVIIIVSLVGTYYLYTRRNIHAL